MNTGRFRSYLRHHLVVCWGAYAYVEGLLPKLGVGFGETSYFNLLFGQVFDNLKWVLVPCQQELKLA